MHRAYLLIGSNQGNRILFLKKATQLLKSKAGKLIKKSSIYETAAWGKEGLPAHLNQALLIQTSLSAIELLKEIHQIEKKLGRQRQEKWGCRTIDIDIIYYDDAIIQTESLTIPHPLLQERRFVLKPLQEIAPNFQHPILQKTNQELLNITQDSLPVQRIIQGEVCSLRMIFRHLK